MESEPLIDEALGYERQLNSVDNFQISIAIKYNIPLSQASTIIYKKVLAYWDYCNTPMCRLEFFLDRLERERQRLARKDAGL
jgi:hypothetical protein